MASVQVNFNPIPSNQEEVSTPAPNEINSGMKISSHSKTPSEQPDTGDRPQDNKSSSVQSPRSYQFSEKDAEEKQQNEASSDDEPIRPSLNLN